MTHGCHCGTTGTWRVSVVSPAHTVASEWMASAGKDEWVTIYLLVSAGWLIVKRGACHDWVSAWRFVRFRVCGQRVCCNSLPRGVFLYLNYNDHYNFVIIMLCYRLPRTAASNSKVIRLTWALVMENVTWGAAQHHSWCCWSPLVTAALLSNTPLLRNYYITY